MLRRTVKFVAVVALVALPSMAQAQLTCVGTPSCSLQPTATLTIPTIVRMQVPSLAVTLDGSTITDLSGAAVVPGPFGDVNVRANRGWSLTLLANAANWTYTGPAADGARSVGTLEVQADNGTFVAVSNVTATPLASSTSASPSAAGTNVNVQFQARIPADFSDPANRPGSYALGLTLTLSAP